MRTRDDEPPREDFDESFIEPAWLLEAIGAAEGVAADAKIIDRAAYKGTACGAWVRFDAEGVIVGIIVEGSDAEYSERISLKGVAMDQDGSDLICERYQQALQNCEDFSEEISAEMEAEND